MLPMQVKISLRRKFPNDLADCPRCTARNFSPSYLELLLHKPSSYETLPKELSLKRLQPQREPSRQRSTNRHSRNNITFMITAN
jgi:hypothetical protein